MSDDLLPEDICYGGLFAIRNTLRKVKWVLKNDPARALARTWNEERKKDALAVDEDAQLQFEFHLKEDYQAGFLKDIVPCGEETIIGTENFTDRSGTFVLADMIDGTDLLERNLSNWCSAVVFFRPRNAEGKRIIAACVGLPSGKIYFAHADKKGAFYKLSSEETRPVGGVSPIKKLNQASICFYGQKVERLKDVLRLPLFDYLRSSKDPKIRTKPTKKSTAKKNRVYTLAGIPMMMKLIDRQTEHAANINVIFENNGQSPHDVIAGAYIARKAGAIMINLDSGTDMTDVELERGLLQPASEHSKLRYVIASSRSLCKEIVPLLRPEDLPPVRGGRRPLQLASDGL